jgi:hypothetical protein
MPAYANKADGSLLVTFARDGEEPERQLVLSPERALIVAMAMLARRFGLYAGDHITVQRADDGVDMTPREVGW